MELERLDLALRQRSPLEAADLGLALLRRWYGPVYRAWFATWVPGMALLFLALWQHPILAGALAWWLKPLFDRVLLKVFAEAVFGEPPGVREVWRALPGLIRDSGLLAGLTLDRLDMARSFHLPIRQLEGQRGPAARARRKVLDHKTRSGAVWLTFICTHFSAFLQISLILLLEMLWPDQAPDPFDWEALFRGESGFWLSLLSHLAWMFGETLVEPFYIAAGFTLYLNRRSELEGWDIELGFRRLARRVDAERPGVASRRVALLAGLGLTGLLWANFPVDSGAAPLPPAKPATESAPRSANGNAQACPAPRPPSTAKQAIEKILADPVFGREVAGWEWRYRYEPDPESNATPHPYDAWISQWVEWLAQAIRVFGYTCIALLVTALAVLLYRQRGTWFATRPAARHVPDTLFGLDLRPDSLPADIAAAAGRQLAQGDGIAALSLLYRGALVALIHTQGVDFQPGDTEDDCRARVRGHIAAGAERYFAELLGAWSLAAYAHAPPPRERLQDLCRRWPLHFAAPETSHL